MTNGFVTDIEKAARDNDAFRRVVFTAGKSQLVLMSLLPGEEIGAEVHDGDQVLYIVDGEGLAVIDGARQRIEKGSIVFVPEGAHHNIVNTDHVSMKLFTLYAPPQHAVGVVQLHREPAHVVGV
jgi:mannose-6-phosphate isomerase-like protein (cupin superfamily)